jgi:hypothetical protein
MSRRRLLHSLFWDASGNRPQNKWMVNLAVTIVLTPALLLFPITIQFFVHPLWMCENWDSFALFLAFYGAPWCLAGFLTYAAATVGDPREPGQ